MDIQNIITLIQAVSDANITNFEMEEGDFKLSLNKVNNKVQVVTENQSISTLPLTTTQNTVVPQVVIPNLTPTILNEVNNSVKETVVDDKVIEIKSPIVGTYYSSSSPEADDFVKVGDKVNKGQVICIIEAMKLLNNIESDYEGTITEVLVKNEQMVEYNQPLFRIKLSE